MINPEWTKLGVHQKPPKEILTKLQVPVKTLMGPGPTNCSKRVLRALQNQVLGHLHTETCQLKDEIKAGLHYVFQTKNRLTLALSASSHGGMEICSGNFLEPGETVVVVKCGIWGERAADMTTRIGGNVHTSGSKLTTETEKIMSAEPAVKFVSSICSVSVASLARNTNEKFCKKSARSDLVNRSNTILR